MVLLLACPLYPYLYIYIFLLWSPILIRLSKILEFTCIVF